jgi:flagellar protein FliS
MNPYQKYRRHEPTGWTRIDMLLALYDKALENLNRAEAALRANDSTTAISLLAKTQLIVTGLAAGIRIDVNPEVNTNMLRLYEFVVNELIKTSVEAITSARKVLGTLREGFETVRDEANELERTGRLPGADQLRMVLATA